jgi:hypothetical protein
LLLIFTDLALAEGSPPLKGVGLAERSFLPERGASIHGVGSIKA